jgi:hypothetical protein
MAEQRLLMNINKDEIDGNRRFGKRSVERMRISRDAV